MKKKSLIFLMPSIMGGGAERVTLNFLSNIELEENNVKLIVFNISQNEKENLPKGIDLINLEVRGIRKGLIKIISILRSTNPDIVFSSLFYINCFLSILKFFKIIKAKILIREANMPSENIKNSSFKITTKLLYKFFYPRVDKIISSSMIMKKDLLETINVNPTKIIIVPNPVEVERIRENSVPIESLKGEGIKIIVVGRLTKQKGIDILIRWLSSINALEWSLAIIGEGELESKLKQLSSKYNLEDKIKFLGFKSNPYPWIAGADVLALTSRWEGMPNAVLEALVCGTPVIATASAGAINELANESVTGAINLIKDQEGFTKVLLQIYNNKGRQVKNSLLPIRYQSRSSNQLFRKILKEI